MSHPHHPHDLRAPMAPLAGPRPVTKPPFVTTLDLIVMAGAMLVAFAAGLFLQLQADTGWELATIVGLGIFAIAATLHIVLQRTEEIARLRAQVRVLQQEIAAVHGNAMSLPPRVAGPALRPRQRVTDDASNTATLADDATAQPGVDRGAALPTRSYNESSVPLPAPSPVPPVGESPQDHGWLPRKPHPTTAALDPDEPLEETAAPAIASPPPTHVGERALEQPHSPPPGAHRDPGDFVDNPLTPVMATTADADHIDAQIPPWPEPAPPAVAARTEVVQQPAPVRIPSGPPPGTHGGSENRGLFSSLSARFSRSRSLEGEAANGSHAQVSLTGPAAGPAPRQRVVSGWHGDSAPVARALGTGQPLMPAPTSGWPRGQSTASADSDHPPTTFETAKPSSTSARAANNADQGNAVKARDSAANSGGHQATSMPPSVDMANSAVISDANPVDALIQSIAHRLAAEHKGVSTDELLALPPPDPDHQDGGDEFVTEGPRLLADAVREAIEAGRVELHLQPILSLDGLATVSYEAFPRLRDASGALVKPADYLGFAYRAGLTADIEKVALLRTIHVMQLLDQRGKLSPIFINVSQELLSDGKFFATFLDAMKSARNLSQNLVLEFAQPIAAAFDEHDLDSLDRLSHLGFTFALDDVDHVEMDFEPLIARGLAFVKVSADALQRGLYAGEATIPTDEIKLLFEDAGLQVIVHHISTEAALDLALTQTITFGQGNLFAEPKPIKAHVLKEAGQAA